MSNLQARLDYLHRLQGITREPGWDQKVRIRAIYALVADEIEGGGVGASVTERFLEFAIAEIERRIALEALTP